MRLERGLYWVENDVDCAAVLFEQVKSIDKHVLPHVTDFSTCVQAGGNCGLFPLELAKRFGTVLTAEPDLANWEALAANAAGKPNILAHNIAFGDKHGSVDMEVEDGNCGASYVRPGQPGLVEMRAIDGFELPNCGLIYLDVEGFEEFALRGAEKTIKRCHPTIVVELKGLAHVYDRTDDDCENYLAQLGYHKVNRFDNDVVWR